MKGFRVPRRGWVQVVVLVACVVSLFPSIRAQPFDGDGFLRDVREYRLLMTSAGVIADEAGIDWLMPRSPWRPFLSEQMTETLSLAARRRLMRDAAKGACDAVAATELTAYVRRYPELEPALAEPDIGPLFRKTIYPSFSHAYARCRALAIVEPLVAETRRFSEEKGDSYDAHSVQFFIRSGRHDATGRVELDNQVLSSAVSTLEMLAACHHDTGALADLLRLEPHLGDLKAAVDRGIYLVRLAEALGVGDPAAFEPMPELWDAQDRARIARIDRTFADMPVAEAVRALPYRADACRLLPIVLDELYRPERNRLVPPAGKAAR